MRPVIAYSTFIFLAFTGCDAFKGDGKNAKPDSLAMASDTSINVPDSVNQVNPDRYKDENGEFVYIKVDENAEFPGGSEALDAYIRQHVQYPPEAVKDNMTGIITVSFIIDKDGEVGGAEILEKVTNEKLNTEALRVIEEMPAWEPGLVDGEPVRIKYILPIVFRPV